MFERILLAVDGSETSLRTVPVTRETAVRFGAEVTVLHVREHEYSWGSDIDLETPDEATELVDGIVRQLKEEGVSARPEVRRVVLGLAPQEILRVAKDIDAQLIVMGTRGLTDWAGLLLGSVAHKVVHHATCPVLLVR